MQVSLKQGSQSEVCVVVVVVILVVVFSLITLMEIASQNDHPYYSYY